MTARYASGGPFLGSDVTDANNLQKKFTRMCLCLCFSWPLATERNPQETRERHFLHSIPLKFPSVPERGVRGIAHRALCSFLSQRAPNSFVTRVPVAFGSLRSPWGGGLAAGASVESGHLSLYLTQFHAFF